MYVGMDRIYREATIPMEISESVQYDLRYVEVI